MMILLEAEFSTERSASILLRSEESVGLLSSSRAMS